MPRKRAALSVSTPRRRREQQKKKKRRRHNDDIHDEDVENQQPPPQAMPPIILPQAFLYAPNTFKPVGHIGAMTIQCQHSKQQNSQMSRKDCAAQIERLFYTHFPNLLQNLYNGQSEQCIHFLENLT